jgi:hypothetical protein
LFGYGLHCWHPLSLHGRSINMIEAIVIGVFILVGSLILIGLWEMWR